VSIDQAQFNRLPYPGVTQSKKSTIYTLHVREMLSDKLTRLTTNQCTSPQTCSVPSIWTFRNNAFDITLIVSIYHC